MKRREGQKDKYQKELIKNQKNKDRKEISPCVKRQKWTDSTSGEKEKKLKAEEADGSTQIRKEKKKLNTMERKRDTEKRRNKYKSNKQIACEKMEVNFINGHQKQSLKEKLEKANTREEAHINLGTKVNS